MYVLLLLDAYRGKLPTITFFVESACELYLLCKQRGFLACNYLTLCFASLCKSRRWLGPKLLGILSSSPQ